MPTAVLLISCADQPGLVHAVADFVLSQTGNIVHAEQHIDPESGVFFQRVEFEFAGRPDADRLAAAFGPTAARFGMTFSARLSDDRPQVAVLAATQPHCLADLLARWRSGELPADIVAVVSRPGPLHADPRADRPRGLRLSHHQHSPLVPACVRRGPAVPPGPAAWREAGRGQPRTTPPPSSTRARSSPRTSPPSATATPSPIWCARAATWRPSSSPGPCGRTSSTGRWSTATRTIVFG